MYECLTRMICAPLKKSPNCASQMIRFLGFSTDIPYSKARTASSERMLLAISRRPPLPPWGMQRSDIRTDNHQMYLHVIEGDVDLVTVLVHQHGVTMREGGAANILATDTNIVTLETVDNQGINYIQGSDK